ncbi:Sir2 histone deacetylase Hst2 [Malassezia cuniculi]|uniref:NAD-dependent protein deacetylase n=1 Tax=Malassezia cuniculi TaxID=948313 RepID=A0AAF0ENJ5_9BASI|nr:Sir2 histone deacetylase Hst2 [Malassezia cuniculi]
MAAVEHVASLITSGERAGISTSAGIPDFRTPGTGLYATLDKYDLPYPEAIFDIRYFSEKPEPFYKLYQELYPDGVKYRPTLTHSFFKLLYDKGKLLRVFTQNIDMLERLAGVPPDALVEAHGSFATARCIRCKRAVEDDWLRERVKSGQVARCERCPDGPPVKPDITFFGESLPDRFFERLRDFYNADLLLVMGTSLAVQPFASLVGEVPKTCPRALFNLERVGVKKMFNIARLDPFYTESGFDFKSDRDTFCQGYVDDTVRLLAQKCGWESELEQVHAAMLKRLDKDVDELSEALKKASIDEKAAVAQTRQEDTAAKGSKDESTGDDASNAGAKASTNSAAQTSAKENSVSTDAASTNDTANTTNTAGAKGHSSANDESTTNDSALTAEVRESNAPTKQSNM